MKFNAWSKERIEQGKKIITCRKRPHDKDPDVYCILGPVPWGVIRTYLFEEEGADSSFEIQEVIDNIFKRRGSPVDDEELFYIHVLKKVEK